MCQVMRSSILCAPAYIFPFIYATNPIKAIMDFQISQKYYLVDSIGNKIECYTVLRNE